MFLFKLFPLTLILTVATIVTGILGYSLLSKYLAAYTLLGFVYTFVIPAILIPIWKEEKGYLKFVYTLVFYVLMPTGVIVWALLTGVVKKI